jgi:hypothetical protein
MPVRFGAGFQKPSSGSGMTPIPGSIEQEACMVLKTLKISMSLLAAATSAASLFAVSWVCLALLGY